MPTPTSGSLKKHPAKGWVCTICPATRKGQLLFLNLKTALNHERTVHNGATSAEVKDKDASHTNGMDILETALDEACQDKIEYSPLTSEGLRQWEMHAHVDHVHDLVPFWQRGIDAAEKGEVLRLEEFLDKMEGDGGWRTAHQVLGMLGVCESKASQSERARIGCDVGKWVEPSEGGGWGPSPFGWAANDVGEGWGVETTRVTSDATESSRGWGVREKWARSELKMGRAGRSNAVQDAGCGTHLQAEPVGAVQGDSRREELRHFLDAITRQEAVNEERRQQLYLFFEMTIEQKIQKIQDTIRFLRTHA